MLDLLGVVDQFVGTEHSNVRLDAQREPVGLPDRT